MEPLALAPMSLQLSAEEIIPSIFLEMSQHGRAATYRDALHRVFVYSLITFTFLMISARIRRGYSIGGKFASFY
jgi:hypothetical protein